jgi:hypothetical protein
VIYVSKKRSNQLRKFSSSLLITFDEFSVKQIGNINGSAGYTLSFIPYILRALTPLQE